MKFNVNEYVKVRLTDYGLSILEQDWNEIRAQAPSLGPWKPPAIDADGYSKHQLWSLMNHFGPHIGMGMKLPFETEIIIGDKK